MVYKNAHDESSNLKDDQDADFTRLVDRALTRRQFLLGAGVTGFGAFFMTSPLAQAVQAGTDKTAEAGISKLMGFKAVPVSTADTVVVPEGYEARALMSWGDPIFADAPEFDPSGKPTAAAQEQQFGDNTDGMALFPIDENRAVLAVNNEYINPELMFAHQGKEMSAEDVKAAQAAHGVTIVELVKGDNGWKVDRAGKMNRRITANTPMEITGPAAGHELLKTAADSTGTKALGTFNNCANGHTPWGTYLTCEENFHGYFGAGAAADDEEDQKGAKIEVSDELKRYGIKPSEKRYQWSYHDERFDFTKNPNEPNRHGYVVEIDPFDPQSIPKKRTALGRFKHENAELVVNGDGHVVVYLGDDERGEHLYKFVSNGKYSESDKAANRELLSEGTLYVAKFTAADGELQGKGEWLELTHGKHGLTAENGFADQGEVVVKTRMAATQVGATTMDRPEWVAAHPDKQSVYCTLTNNKNRGKEGQPVGGPNPRENNVYGQIVRWKPAGGDHTAAEFDWDIYVLAGNPTVHAEGLNSGSANINKDNMFNSPDGIGFDADGRFWIQTDGNYSNEKDFAGMGNNQMLCGDPATGEIRRFMTGPVACEITGLTFTPDYKAMFVGIQHPGEDLQPSNFPGGGDSKPRSTVMVITRKDGGVIGA
ncbi:MAG: PhoX family phosphatase [Thiolinea sp.]